MPVLNISNCSPSVGVADARKRVADHFAVEIMPTAFYDYPTIAELAKHVAGLVSFQGASVPSPQSPMRGIHAGTSRADIERKVRYHGSVDFDDCLGDSWIHRTNAAQVKAAMQTAIGGAFNQSATFASMGFDSITVVDLTTLLGT